MTAITQLFRDIVNKLQGLYGNYKFTIGKSITGLDDAVFSGTFTGNSPSTTVTIAIDSVGAVDTFSFTYNSVTQSFIPITAGKSFDLFSGISITFGAKTGHTINDSWTFTATGSQLIKTIRLDNNQIESERNGETYDYGKPALFLSFQSLNDIQQMGAGVQIYNDMRLKARYVREFLNAYTGDIDNKDGTFEEDLNHFIDAQRVFSALQKFEGTKAVAMVRVEEEIDYNHDNLIVFTQIYKLNLIDSTANDPVGYVIKYPITGYVSARDTNVILAPFDFNNRDFFKNDFQ